MTGPGEGESRARSPAGDAVGATFELGNAGGMPILGKIPAPAAAGALGVSPGGA